MFNPNKLHLRALTGKHGFISLAAAAKLRCNAWRALSSYPEDDDFSELGSPLPKAATNLPKLMMEKSEPYNKKANRRRKLSGVPLESSTGLKSDSSIGDFSELGSPLPKSATNLPKLMTEKSEPYNKKANSRRKLSGVPLESSTGLKSDSSIQESIGASKRPVLSDEVSLNCLEPISRPPDNKEAVNVKITNINSETTDSAIHSMCTTYGSLKGLVRTKKDAVDAFFSIKDNDIDSILTKLNDTVMNDHKWSANLHQRDSADAVISKQCNANLDVGLHISNELAELRRQSNMKTVCVEDLEYLHNALVHLNARPDSRTSITNDD